MSVVPVNFIREIFDLDDGKFSLVQNDLLLCYNFIGGVRGTIAVSLFNRIIRNVFFKKFMINEEILRIGSLWSNPLTISEIMADCFSRFDSETRYKSTKNNYNTYITDLIDNKVFYKFGKNNFYAYTYEKNIFSWGYMCKDVSYVYPQTLRRLIKTEDDLFNLFWNVKKTGSDFYVMEMDEFVYNFACFIDQVIISMAPTVKNRFRRFDKVAESAKLYLDEIRSVLEKTKDFEGYEEDCMFQINLLPLSLQERFDASEITPSEQNGSKPFKPILNKYRGSQLYAVRKAMERTEEARDLSEGSLRVSEKPSHLISLLERKIKEIRGITGDKVVIKNVVRETEACKSLYDLFVDYKLNKETFIREWIDWYVRNMEEKISADYIIITSLSKTFLKFKEEKEREEREKGAYSSLYENINDCFKKSIDIEQICRKYGLIFVYNYLWVTQGRKEAEAQFENLLFSLEAMLPQVQRSVLWEMQKATHCNRSRRCGYFDKDSLIKVKMGEFLVKTACTYKDFGLSSFDRPNSEEAAFWEKIKHELTNREKTKT